MRRFVGPFYALGLVALVSIAAILHSRVLAPTAYDLTTDQRTAWWTLFTVFLVASAYALGLPSLAGGRWAAVVRGLAAVAAAAVVIAIAQTALATALVPRSALAVIAATTPIWSVIAWNLSADVANWDSRRDRVFVVVGTADDLTALKADLGRRPERPATIVDHLLLDEILVRSHSPLLTERFAASNASLLVMDSVSHSHSAVIEQAADIHRAGSRVRTLSLFYEEWIGKLPHSELARVSLLFDVGELHRRRYVQAKRIVDVSFAAFGLLVLVPVLAVVAAGNLLWNPGPLLFRQARVGKNGREFTIYKLRTMTAATDNPDPAGGSTWTATADVRVTPLGRWLRRSHLDELPQVINILNGDLSLVGPRPEQPHYVAQLAEKIDFFDVRHIVRPGITGWAQVNQGYVADDAGSFDKLQYDFYYLRRQGLGLDAKILWRTVRGVVAGDGR